MPLTSTVSSWFLLADFDAAGAGDAGDAHAAGDHGGVAGHAAARGEDAFRDFHAVNVVGLRFGANQNHGSGLRFRHSVVGAEHDYADGGAGRGGKAGRDQVEGLARGGIEHRVQQLIELLRIDALHGFALGDETFADHLDGDAHRGRAGALAVAGLQHVELVIFDGELEVLHVAIVLLEVAGDLAELVVNIRHDILELVDGKRACGCPRRRPRLGR